MNGITIIEQPCPRCANRRIVRLGHSGMFLCFNCRRHWTVVDGPREHAQDSVVPQAGPSTYDYWFNDAQVRRLHVYRAAVRAGFYTDW